MLISKNKTKTLLATYSNQLVQAVMKSRDLRNQQVRISRLGLKSGDTEQQIYVTFFRSAMSNAAKMLPNGTRKKVLTCEDIIDKQDLICSYSMEDIRTLTENEIRSCLSVFGSATGCTYSQLVSLGSFVLTVRKLFSSS